MSDVIIGHSNRKRPWQIFSHENPPKGVKYIRAHDFPFYKTPFRSQFLLHTKYFGPWQSVDLYHTYNDIVVNRRPWIIEVESRVPRYGPLNESDGRFRWAIERLKSEDCRHIAFVSQHAANLCRPRFESWGIPWEKTSVLYRALPVFGPGVKDDDTFRVLFAGNAFFRKGGLELLKAFEQVAESHWRLDIISNFEIDYRVFPSTEQQHWTSSKIANDSRIQVQSNLPHKEVIKHMQKADVFVATTYHDAFNNTILEAMSCGVPVITSDVVSIPEFVEHERNGFIVGDPNALEKEVVVSRIARHLQYLAEEFDMRSRMGKQAETIVTDRFSLMARNKSLTNIIHQALS